MGDERDQDEAGAPTDDSFEALLKRVAHVSGPAAASLGLQLHPGSTFLEGRLRIVRRIGEGGMGVVYEAFDERRRTTVALKTLNRLDAGDVYRLKSEFRSLAEVSHAGLCRLHELFVEGAQWFFTMELIDGVRFDQWVRPGGPAREARVQESVLDETRLRAALPQLCEAIAAIHAAGKLHRDLKPSNVLVTRNGRVVVLDFGLAVDPELGGVGQTVMDANVSGTPAYMAPEQAAGSAATTASDFYALGAMLFEALTGKLPFEGRAGEMLGAKQHRDAPRVSALLPQAPADLATLCDALLAREPAQRPGAAALRVQFASSAASLSDTASSQRSSLPTATAATLPPLRAPDAVALLGRELELAVLREAFLESCAGKKPVIVLLAGESGIGKSALCEVFLAELRAQHRAIVLSGRCFERESVPFKAFDVVVDELSRHLRRLGDDAKSLLPRDTFALRRIFPVLGRIAAIAEAPERAVPDAQDLRQRAFAAFGELLGRMRDREPLVLHLDDLQWSDTDSTSLLMHLVRQADAPKILLVASHRSEQMQGHPHLSPLYEALPIDIRLDVRKLHLEPLPTEAAHALLRAQLGTVPAELAREAGGNPFLLSELGRHAAAHAHEPAAELSLKYVVVARAAALPEAERRLLQVLSVAGRPIELELAVEAAGTDAGPRTLFETLRDAHLARATGDGTLVECFHDKVREALLGALTPDALREHHAALAQALAARPDSDAEQLSVHLLGAGETERAAVQLVRAADLARTELSFDRAVRLYTQALADGRFEPVETQRLRIARADALAEAGRGVLAAEAYLEAMQNETGEAAHALEHRAAEQYLFSGRIKDGRDSLARSLRRHGVRMPTSTVGTLASLVVQRSLLRLRGLSFRERTPDAAMTEQLDRLYWVTIELLRVDPAAGAELLARHLRLALRAGDAVQVARGLTSDIFVRAIGMGDAKGVLDLIARVEAQLARKDDPVARAWLHFGRGCYLYTGPEPDLPAALADIDRHLALLSEHRPPNATYHRSMAKMNGVSIRVQLGRLAEVARDLPELLDTAFELGDFAVLPLVAGFGAQALIAVGALDEAERQLARASAAWSSINNPYAMQDVFLFYAEVQVALARREPRVAWERAQQELVRLAASPLRRVPILASMVRTFAGTAALALAASTHGTERAELLRVVRVQRKGLMPQFVQMLAVGLANLEGPHAHSVEVARTTLGQLHRVKSSPLTDVATRRACGLVLGGDEGAALVAEADAFLRAGGCVDPEHFAGTVAPGVRPQ